ncbi:uncharacterized protein LOC117269326 [Epinephelus lanceolatus]
MSFLYRHWATLNLKQNSTRWRDPLPLRRKSRKRKYLSVGVAYLNPFCLRPCGKLLGLVEPQAELLKPLGLGTRAELHKLLGLETQAELLKLLGLATQAELLKPLGLITRGELHKTLGLGEPQAECHMGGQTNFQCQKKAFEKLPHGQIQHERWRSSGENSLRKNGTLLCHYRCSDDKLQVRHRGGNQKFNG